MLSVGYRLLRRRLVLEQTSDPIRINNSDQPGNDQNSRIDIDESSISTHGLL
jgi:hypothetical protein